MIAKGLRFFKHRTKNEYIKRKKEYVVHEIGQVQQFWKTNLVAPRKLKCKYLGVRKRIKAILVHRFLVKLQKLRNYRY